MNTERADIRQHLLDVARTLMGSKGYSAVGLAEIVATAGVPKGSFYYYFKSKEDFGQAMLEDYFDNYAVRATAVFAGPGQSRERLLSYFKGWADSQSCDDANGRCLATKLGAEVCDLSEGMRSVLDKGARANIERLTLCIEAGYADQSIVSSLPAATLAKSLYELWMGASLLAKLNHSNAAFESAMALTERSL